MRHKTKVPRPEEELAQTYVKKAFFIVIFLFEHFYYTKFQTGHQISDTKIYPFPKKKTSPSDTRELKKTLHFLCEIMP